MLMNYSWINRRTEALKTGQVVRWKGEKKGRYYVNEISLD